MSFFNNLVIQETSHKQTQAERLPLYNFKVENKQNPIVKCSRMRRHS